LRLACALLAAVLLAGCASNDDEVGPPPRSDDAKKAIELAEEARIADEVWWFFDGVSSGEKGSVPRDVSCDRRRRDLFACTAYVEAQARGVALFAEYTVRPCGPGVWGRMSSAPDSLVHRLPRTIDSWDCSRRSP
jgi:hypothetical protein